MKWRFWRKDSPLPYPEAIFGLRKPQDVAVDWSDPCGCFERHLQRRYMNPLFPLQRRRVCTGDIIEARARDQADLAQVQADCGKTLKDSFQETTRAPKQRLTFKQVDRHLETYTQLIKRSAEIGDLANPARDSLSVPFGSLIELLRNYMQEVCPTEVKAELNSLITKRERYLQTFAHPFVAQMNRKDTPISAKEVVLSLLSEPTATVRLVASILPEANRRELHSWAATLIANVQREGHTVPEAEEKLLALKGCP